jgi:hypothetical protein
MLRHLVTQLCSMVWLWRVVSDGCGQCSDGAADTLLTSLPATCLNRLEAFRVVPRLDSWRDKAVFHNKTMLPYRPCSWC